MTRKPAPGRTDDRGPRTIWLTNEEWEALGLIAEDAGQRDKTKYIRAHIAAKIKAIRRRESMPNKCGFVAVSGKGAKSE